MKYRDTKSTVIGNKVHLETDDGPYVGLDDQIYGREPKQEQKPTEVKILSALNAPIRYQATDDMLLAYFAGQALAGQLANAALSLECAMYSSNNVISGIVSASLIYADAMFIEYKKRTAK